MASNPFDSNDFGGSSGGVLQFFKNIGLGILSIFSFIWNRVIVGIWKMKGALGIIGRIMLVFLAFYLGFNVYCRIYGVYTGYADKQAIVSYIEKKYNKKKAAKPALDPALSSDSLLANLDIPSDIEGMTKADKVRMGLAPENGSDTDGDGLTDKDEIEKYHTDPLKMSTTGDLMTDKEKVDAGLDPTQKADKYIKKDYVNNKEKDVTLTATCPEDFNAYVEAEDGIMMLENRTLYKTYIVSGYSGKLTIAVKSYLKDNKIKPSDLNVFVALHGDDKAKAYKFTVDKDKITLKKNFNKDTIYDVYVAKKKGFLDISAKAYMPTLREAENENAQAIAKAAGVSVNSIAKKSVVGNYTPNGIVCGFPIPVMFQGKLTVYYRELPSKEATLAERDNLVMAANAFMKTVNHKSELDANDKIFVKAATDEEITNLYALLKRVYPGGEWTKDDFYDQDLAEFYPKFGYIYFTYQTISNMSTLQSKWKHVKMKSGMAAAKTTGETVEAPDFGYDDILPFQNPLMGDPGHGICVGMANTIANVYNHDGLDETEKKGTYTTPKGQHFIEDINVSWNLSGEKNKTLFDAKLNDVEKVTSNFTDNKSKEAIELEKYIYSRWAKGNISLSESEKKGKIKVCKGSRLPDVKFIYQVISRLSEGKVVTITLPVGFQNKDWGNHSINISKAVTLKKDSVWILYGYDNNYPYKEAVNTIALICTKIPGSNGKEDTFTFQYAMVGMNDVEKAAFKKATGIEFPNYKLKDIPEDFVYDMAILNDDTTALD